MRIFLSTKEIAILLYLAVLKRHEQGRTPKKQCDELKMIEKQQIF